MLQRLRPVQFLYFPLDRAVLVHADSGSARQTGLQRQEGWRVWRQGLQTLHEVRDTYRLHGLACHVPTPQWTSAAERRGAADIIIRIFMFCFVCIKRSVTSLWPVQFLHLPLYRAVLVHAYTILQRKKGWNVRRQGLHTLHKRVGAVYVFIYELC